jgi:hypothetical protein
VLKKKLKIIYIFFLSIGIDLRKLINIFSLFSFLKDFFFFKKKGGKIDELSPILGEKKLSSGNVDKHYFLLDIFIANLIFKKKPKKHLDLGSRFDGFVSHLASFRKVDVMDLRRNRKDLININFIKNNFLTKPKKNFKERYDSLSSLHVIEHIGLGRYGDQIQVNGHKIAFRNVINYLKKNGLFYFAVPIGKKTITMFNAQRIFAPKEILKWSDKIELVNFHFIDDEGKLKTNISTNDRNLLKQHYACGIYIFKKI